MAENVKPRPSSAGSAGEKLQRRESPQSRSASAGKSREAHAALLRGGAAAENIKAGMPALPLGQRENNRNSFNAAKARADKEAMGGAISSRTSTNVSSRRSSQVSTSTGITTGRPGMIRGRKKKRGQNDPLKVFNENGKDVTPKPLSSLKPTVLTDKLMSISALSAEGTEYVHSVPIYSRTGFSVTSTAGELTPEPVELSTNPDISHEFDGQESRRSRRLGGSAIFETPRRLNRKYAIIPAPIVEVTAPKDLEKPVPILITESENCIMLNMRGHNLNETYSNYKAVMERNEKYARLKEEKQGNLDNYTANITQTLFSLLKNKEAQASALSTQSNSIQVNSWDIADSVAGKVKPDQYQPWKVVPHGSKDNKSTNPTTTVVLLPELFTESDGPNTGTPPSSPPESRRQSTASRKGSTAGGYSRRPSASVQGQQSRRTSVASRRVSTSGVTSQAAGQGLDDVLRLMSPFSAVTGAGSVGGSQAGGEAVVLPEADISKIPGLFKAFEHIERACVLNAYHDRLLDYMDFRAREDEPPPPEPPPELDKDGKPKKKKVGKDEPPPPVEEPEEKEEVIPKVILPPLEDSTATVHSIWDFQCDATEGRNISCMSWNKMNRHLIAVGYGEFEFGGQRDGMIAFWSLKNPRYPHAVLTTLSGVTSVDFAISSPSLLAVGFYSGNVAIYDVRNPRDLEPMMKSSSGTGKHTDPVWKVQWVDHAAEQGEGLVSISTDGRVSKWSIKKDLEFVNLMKLKPSQLNKGAQPQPFISRRSAGLCFEFSKKDIGIYLVGTEEGPIYKCDRSYNEQYLMTYSGHNGPVYQVRWSPFMDSLFLSCSADWTVRLWSEDQERALLVFQTTNMAIADVQWSFTHACVFAVASTDGHMEMWDLHLSVMKPIVAHVLAPDDESSLSCMMFSEEAPLILLGGSTGVLYILKFDGLLREATDLEELKKLKDALTASITRHGAG